jgi:type I protein arginine methyltransferase
MPPTNAANHLKNSLLNCPIDSESLQLGQYIPLHYHFQMLQDRQRLAAFRRAMELHVKPNMHVLELGGGTGILSSFAARLGANVTCVEHNSELVRFARNAIRENGLADRVEVIHADASCFIPKEPVHAVICEMLHVGLLREKQTEIISAFKSNYQAHWDEPMPRFFPEASRLMVQLIDHAFDFEGYYAPLPIFQSPDQSANDELRELSTLVDYAHVLYDQPISEAIHWSGDFEIIHDGFLSGLRFVTQNYLSIESNGVSPVWPNQFLIIPIRDPSPVLRGQTVRLKFVYRYGDQLQSLQDACQVSYSVVLT